jgi:membrane protein YdbS with pleckstrin-like domain
LQHFGDSTIFMVSIISAILLLIAVGLMALGYYVAGHWWKGGAQWAMGIFLGLLFILAAVAIFVGGCTLLLYRG